MPKRTVMVFATVLIAVLVFVGGLAVYPMLFPSPRQSASEGLGLGGYFYINAYHSNGQLFASWQGHNSLTGNGINGVAQCLSGQELPSFLGTCSGVSAYVFVNDVNFTEWRATANNSLYPLGCNPNANPGTCSGWQAKGTISFNTGTFPTSINRAGTEGSSLGALDYAAVSPIMVNKGDYLTVTVVFTIS